MRERAALADNGTTLLRRPKTLMVALNFAVAAEDIMRTRQQDASIKVM